MATNISQEDFHKTGLRLPKDLHARLHEAAATSGRSYNAEIVARLQSTFKPEQKSLDFSSQPEFVEFRKEVLDQVRKMIDGHGGEVVHKSSKPFKKSEK